jgi:hypothetical protein
LALREETRLPGAASEIDRGDPLRHSHWMFLVAGRLFTVLALCGALGLQWAALQSTAWTLMLIENAKKESLARAVKYTFDGAHPCSLCRGISEARSSEKSLDLASGNGDAKQKPPGPTRSLKVDLLLVARRLFLSGAFKNLSYEWERVQILERHEAPPVPPPRLLLS